MLTTCLFPNLQNCNPFGYGWTYNQDIRLIFPTPTDPGFVNFKDQSGNLYWFWDTGIGKYIPYAGYTASLTKNAGTPVTYTLQDQARSELVSSAPQEEIAPTAPATALPVATVMPAPIQPTPQEPPSGFTYTSQPDGATGEDTYLLSKSADRNYGEEMELRIGESSEAQDEVARGLIRFDLSSIPANAVVTSAWLSLWPAVDSAENDRTIRVYRLKTGFEEAGATWQEAAAGVPWEAEGASGIDDRENAAIGSAPILGSEPVGVEKQIMLSTSKLEEWIDGTFANHGLLVVVETELDDRFSYEFLLTHLPIRSGQSW